MIDGIMPAARTPRAPQAKTPADPQQAQAQQQLDAATAAFNLETEVTAEREREEAALEQLVLAQLKDEDEVMKKWIAMIG
jgi:hypothetical protein